ncbi:hypothetical protein BHM03_00040185 [Ensete ventricosum]|nr:hypothetical protein BHM03_00040185 [Ensete ventricosum]
MPSIKPDSATSTTDPSFVLASLFPWASTPTSLSLSLSLSLVAAYVINRWRTRARPTASISSWPSSSLHWVSSSSSDARWSSGSACC